ncbi:Hypothetical protein I5071_69560 [Sandaracinus amylolyticus]|nr:Hypothetical protein I5071_69560 [Sandaracinus amylolyticus]
MLSACSNTLERGIELERLGLDGGADDVVGCSADGGCVPLGGTTPGCDGCVDDPCQVATCDGLSCTRRDRADGTTCPAGICVAGTCVTRRCGDGYPEPGPTPPREPCDDGNAVSGDGCSVTCEPETLTIEDGAAARVPPAVAIDARGEALVVWVAEIPGDDAREIRAQRLGARGNPAGLEVAITRVAGLGSDIEVEAAGREAGWAVAWSAPGADRDGLGVRFAYVSESGAVSPRRNVRSPALPVAGTATRTGATVVRSIFA